MTKQLLLVSLVFLFSSQLLQAQGKLQQENDSLRMEIRLVQIQQQSNSELKSLSIRIEDQDKLLSTIQEQTNNWTTFTEIFFGIVGVIIGLFAFFGFRQIKQYSEIAKRDQQELEKIVKQSKEQEVAIKARHDELQKLDFEDKLSEQSKKVIDDTLTETKKQLENVGFDALKNLYQAKALKAYDTKDWSNCIRYCLNYLDFNENNTEILQKLSFSMRKSGNLSEALTYYTKAIELNPTNDKSYNNRGNVYFELDNVNSALKDYTQAIKLNPTNAKAYMNRAILYVKNNDFNSAEVDYNKALEIDPNYALCYYNRYLLNLKKGDNIQASLDLKRARELDSDNTTFEEITT